MERFNLLYHDPKVGKGLWEWISTYVMARGIFEKRRRSLQNAIGLFKRFFKGIFPSEKHFGFESK